MTRLPDHTTVDLAITRVGLSSYVVIGDTTIDVTGAQSVTATREARDGVWLIVVAVERAGAVQVVTVEG